jgi:threonine dehydrogenase-like Zn-dependent dehydrogenase
MQALEMYRSVPRYVAARASGQRAPAFLAQSLIPLRLVRRERRPTPSADWLRIRPRLAGICGSDLAFLTGRFSLYFAEMASFPFEPGHEVVGEVIESDGSLPNRTRVVIDPVLACAARGLDACAACASGTPGHCNNMLEGSLPAGAQTGYCSATGGGWSEDLLAHASQVHTVPDALSDEAAVLLEPLACAIHSVLRAQISPGETVLVVGAGTIGLLTLLALRRLARPGRILIAAKYAAQREWARKFGADDILAPHDAVAAVRRATRAHRVSPPAGGDYLLGGADVTFVCAGASPSLNLALRTTRAGGRVVLTGLPEGGADLAPVWQRELHLIGVYASGLEISEDTAPVSAFDLATSIALETPAFGQLVAAHYPLGRWRAAIDHALDAGRLGAVKLAFAPRAA